MSVGLETIGLFVLGGLLYGLFVPGRARGWALLIASVVGIYWLQTAAIIRFSDYILQTITLILTILVWWVVRQPEPAAATRRLQLTRTDALTLLLLAALTLALSLNRFLDTAYRLTPSRPPNPLWVAVALIGTALLLLGLSWLARRISLNKLLFALIWLIVILFVLLKWPPAATAVAQLWRSFTGQQIALAAPTDLVWLGFSYVAFRLIHTLRDRQTGLLPALTLREFVTYVLFLPAYTAGPIDRAERFVADLRQLPTEPSALQWLRHRQPTPTDYATRYGRSAYRILIGLFKKFVIADSLALGLSLTAVTAEQATSPAALWLLLYGYALRLFFDFSGYTDIAIGIGLLFGITLPENFQRPYRQSSITTFWQSWHITLSNWARFYIFTPLSRALLRRQPRPPNSLILLTAHLTTMTVIGLWHGITPNYFIWGLWHGIALFIHKQWSDRTRKWYRGLGQKPTQRHLWTAVTWFITFNYVVLGWVWFTLPTPQLAAQTFLRLFGIGW